MSFFSENSAFLWFLAGLAFFVLFFSGPGRSENDSFGDPLVRERYLGREVLVMKPITPEQDGQAELDGTNWRARSEGGTFAAGERARVERIEDLMLVVSKTEQAH